MKDPESKVIVIPANPNMSGAVPIRRQLRVAAYCRVSTDDEEQLTSYEAQKNYYTDKIMTNREWTMAGIFADEGITGTSARKRPEFQRMIHQCRQKKIDIILTKSISRFARNTVDCLNYIRTLKELGIAVIFEKENINTLETESEIMITLLGAFAQAESESISANVRWGKRQAMREGKISIQYSNFYGYIKGEDGKPQINPEEAEVVRRIFRMYLGGASFRMIQRYLGDEEIPNSRGVTTWHATSIRTMLMDEKYCGDVLMQKTFVENCITKKVIRNTGQLPMYLIKDHHEGIISHEVFDAVQSEIARRTSMRTSSKYAPTGMSCYASKYALSERLVCGECGTLFRRCTWTQKGEKRIVWRCLSRLEFGSKYCHKSPSLHEKPLQRAILAAINSVMSRKEVLIRDIMSAIEAETSPIQKDGLSISDVDTRLEEISTQTRELIAAAAHDSENEDYIHRIRVLSEEAADLKKYRAKLTQYAVQRKEHDSRSEVIETVLEQVPSEITEWDESMIRQLVETVKVISKTQIIVCLKNGSEIEQTITY